MKFLPKTKVGDAKPEGRKAYAERIAKEQDRVMDETLKHARKIAGERERKTDIRI